MDIMGALAVASHTIKLAKEVKDLERDLDTASFKAKMADLYDNLAEIKMALTDAKEELHQKEAEIKKLHSEISTLKSGELCPLCQNGRLKVIAVQPHPQFGVFGHKLHSLECQNADCSHTESRKVVPVSG
jgi:phosphomevalonate kinase